MMWLYAKINCAYNKMHTMLSLGLLELSQFVVFSKDLIGISCLPSLVATYTLYLNVLPAYPVVRCRIQKMPRLLVASQDGYLYIYNIDPVEGGECTLLKQHRYSMGRSGNG